MKYEVAVEAGSKDGWSEPMLCRFCGGWATRGALSEYGARCQNCYDKWCRAAFEGEYSKPTNSSKPSPRDVMNNLRTFEARTGRKPSEAQKHVLAALEKLLDPPVVSD